MSAIHYINKCGFDGYFSEYTADKEKVTCSRCKNKYRIEKPKPVGYLVKRNGYMNILEKQFIMPNEDIYDRFIVS